MPLIDELLLSLRIMVCYHKLSTQIVHGIASFTRACIQAKREVHYSAPFFAPTI
jgi:hypothetical protein